MRLIIAGSRDLNPTDAEIDRAVATFATWPRVILSGGARGVDTAGERWAIVNGVVIDRYPADWLTHGKAAGPIRNRLMADNADALLAYWDGRSSGTKHMIDVATKRGLRLKVVTVAGGGP